VSPAAQDVAEQQVAHEAVEHLWLAVQHQVLLRPKLGGAFFGTLEVIGTEPTGVDHDSRNVVAVLLPDERNAEGSVQPAGVGKNAGSRHGAFHLRPNGQWSMINASSP